MIDTRTDEQKFHDEMLEKADALRQKEKQWNLEYAAYLNNQGDGHDL